MANLILEEIHLWTIEILGLVLLFQQ